jgi:hypothetical protein
MKKITRIKDINGKYYNVISYSILEMLRIPLFKESFSYIPFMSVLKLLWRNKFSYHITVRKGELGQIVDDISFVGIGEISRNNDKAWFIVVESETLKTINPDFDYHITLGFTNKDIHDKNIKKDKSTVFAWNLKEKVLN